MSPDDLKRLSASPQTGAPILAGCIDYAFVGETKRHQTRFVYEIDKKGSNNTALILNPTEGDIPIPDVLVNINPMLAGNPD